MSCSTAGGTESCIVLDTFLLSCFCYWFSLPFFGAFLLCSWRLWHHTFYPNSWLISNSSSHLRKLLPASFSAPHVDPQGTLSALPSSGKHHPSGAFHVVCYEWIAVCVFWMYFALGDVCDGCCSQSDGRIATIPGSCRSADQFKIVFLHASPGTVLSVVYCNVLYSARLVMSRHACMFS